MVSEIDDTEEYELLAAWAKLEKEPEKLTEAEKGILRGYGIEI